MSSRMRIGGSSLTPDTLAITEPPRLVEYPLPIELRNRLQRIWCTARQQKGEILVECANRIYRLIKLINSEVPIWFALVQMSYVPINGKLDLVYGHLCCLHPLSHEAGRYTLTSGSSKPIEFRICSFHNRIYDRPVLKITNVDLSLATVRPFDAN